jgi:hypothetical protein
VHTLLLHNPCGFAACSQYVNAARVARQVEAAAERALKQYTLQAVQQRLLPNLKFDSVSAAFTNAVQRGY